MTDDLCVKEGFILVILCHFFQLASLLTPPTAQCSQLEYNVKYEDSCTKQTR